MKGETAQRNTEEVPSAWTGRATPFLILGSVVFLYLQCFILPHTPIYQGDTAPIFLQDAVRILNGQVIYRDFFELTYPGTPLAYAAFFKVFGLRSWIPSITMIALGTALFCLGIVVSRRLVKGSSVFLPSVLFLALTFGTALDPNHHWFSTLAVVAALALLLEERSTWRLAGAGALCGLASWFTQSRGVASVGGFVLFLYWEFRAKRKSWRWLARAEGCLLAAMLAATLPFAVYFAGKAGLQQFWFCTVTFIRLYYPAYRWNKLSAYMAEGPDFPELWMQIPALGLWLSIHLLIPMVFLLFLARYRLQRDSRPEEPWDRLMLVNFTGLFLFLGIAFAPSWQRLCQAGLPAFILLVWFINSIPKRRRLVLGAAWSVALLGVLIQPVMTQTGLEGYLDAPTGRTAFASTTFSESGEYEKFQWVLRQTRPGEFLYNARDSDMYFLLNLRNPAPVPFVTNTDYTRPEQVARVIESLERERVRLVLWWPELDLLQEDDPPAGDHLGPLRAYLRRSYRVVKTFEDGVQVWERTR